MATNEVSVHTVNLPVSKAFKSCQKVKACTSTTIKSAFDVSYQIECKDQLQLPVARNQNLECVYFGGNKNSIAGIAMQGTKFRITHKRISSRTLISQKNI